MTSGCCCSGALFRMDMFFTGAVLHGWKKIPSIAREFYSMILGLSCSNLWFLGLWVVLATVF